MKFPRNARVFRGQLDASPFIGVLFIVVIFLLLHSSLVFTPGVRIDLPGSPELPGPTNATLTVAVDRDGHFYFENQLAAEETVKAALERRKPERVTLVVMADKNVRNETLVRLLNLARDAGVADAYLATRPPLRAQPPRPVP
jgi:biopolymer transport protein ExbD